MAAFEPPRFEMPSRRRGKEPSPYDLAPEHDSRAARNRVRREKSMERRFTWLFVAAVVSIVLYLASRTPVGLTVMHHLLTPTAR